MESNTIIVLIALAYGAFLGYCLGRMSRGIQQRCRYGP
jgi:hypothetical protein